MNNKKEKVLLCPLHSRMFRISSEQCRQEICTDLNIPPHADELPAFNQKQLKGYVSLEQPVSDTYVKNEHLYSQQITQGIAVSRV